MNKLLLSVVFVILMGIALMGQTRVSGIVKDASTGKEVYDLSVLLVETGEEVRTDRIGYFQFVDVKPGTYTIRISGTGYSRMEQPLMVGNENRIELGDLNVQFNPISDTLGVITLTEDELDDDESSSQSSVGLLQSSQDVFASTAAYDLGAYWFRVRGYDNKYNDVFFNGVKMNKIDNGRVTFNNWGGLNDITRRPSELTYGLEPSSTALGDIGGVTNFDTRPSTLPKRTSLSYSFTNRSYRNRVMATYNTGLMNNGWGFTVSGSRRWAEEGRIEGTFYDAWAYYLGVEKKFNDRHTLHLTAFGAPNRRATNSPNTQEVYDLAGTDYNSYWGWQDGEKRSERVRKTHEPIAMLTHHWNIGNNSKLLTSVAYQMGSDSGTRLDWYKANNPSPTYYRNMPSFYLQSGQDNPAMAEMFTNMWKDGSFGQLDWTSLYGMNHLRNLAGKSAAYVLAEDFQDDKTLTVSTNFKTKIESNIDLVMAVTYQNTKSENYREIADLLGGNFFSNVDDFADAGQSGQFDSMNPDREVKEGDRYEYDYEINRQYADFFIQTKANWDWLTWTFGATVSNTSFYREGNFQHYLYMNDSYGKSKTYDFWNFGVKTNFLFKFDGRNFIALNGQYSTNAPTADEVFVNARGNSLSVPDLKNAQIMSGELSYIYRAPRVKAKATGFYTLAKDEMEKSFGYIDNEAQTYFAAELLNGVDKQYFGTELAIEAQVTTAISVTAVASIGQYTYNNNPDYYLFSDDLTGGYKDFGKTYLKDYKLSNGPQQGYSLGIEYRSPNYWWLGVSGNYLMANYFDVSPFNRTRDFADLANNPDTNFIDEGTLRSLLKQHQTTDEFMLNVNVGKTFRFGKYNMGISGTVNNVLNNKNYITSGFEQMRGGSYQNMLDENYRTTFGPKMWYDQGISYFLNVYFRF
ncbi:carboxypeptidase-like regulatory domain-containing protein [Moheibacter stercoris]|uniref:TonB-dependent receptor n=1 Tax=Moheibacter stercoris TaxID=1628251 RepID=A0ABV2LPZ0_9FLAO